MTDYRRLYVNGAMWFFTVNLAHRHQNTLLVDEINLLRESFRYVKKRHAFTINSIVIMPEHLHCIWTLPEGDTNYPRKISSSRFLAQAIDSTALPKNARLTYG